VDYAAALFEQNRLLGELISDADHSGEVPTCPGWTLRQLLRHVGRGHRWAAQIVSDRVEGYLDPRTVRDGKPPEDRNGALDWLHGSARAIVDAVSEVGQDTPVWTFLGPRPAAWWIRRRLHEETVHRADAALALGVGYQLSAELGADGLSEWLDMVAAGRGAGQSAPLDVGTTLHLHATDDGLGSAGEWLVARTGDGVSWEHGHTKATTAVRGRAVDLLLATLRRRSAEEVNLEVLGDPGVWRSWLDRTSF
jgi:uncharacterized protein (TIGR03083 family)